MRNLILILLVAFVLYVYISEPHFNSKEDTVVRDSVGPIIGLLYDNLTKGDKRAIDNLKQLLSINDEFGVHKRQGVGEFFRIVKSDDLPAKNSKACYEWLCENQHRLIVKNKKIVINDKSEIEIGRSVEKSIRVK